MAAREGSKTETRGPSWFLLRLFSDPWRKVAAIGLAVLLWYFLDAQITKQAELVCHLHVVDAEETMRSVAEDGQSVLDVRIPGRSFSHRAFRDAFNADPDHQLTKVTLYFRGPKRIIDKIGDEHLWVSYNRLKPQATSFVFDVDDIEARRDLRDTIQGMSPPSVRVEIEPNERKEIALSEQNVLLIPPDPSNGEVDLSRLILEKARFRPEIAKFWGTKSNLARITDDALLFRLDLSTIEKEDMAATEIQRRIWLVEPIAELVEAREPEAPTIVIPLRPTFREFSLSVPVMLDLRSTDYAEEDFEPIPYYEVKLRAAGLLATELVHLQADSAEELQKWTDDHLRVVAHLGRDKTANSTIEGQLIFLGDPWREGTDYTYSMLPINLKLEKQND